MARLTPELRNDVSAARKAAGLTQEQLAVAADVSRQTIGAMEKGDYSPSTVLALRLSSLLDVPVGELFWLPEKAVEELEGKRERLGFPGRREDDAGDALVAGSQRGESSRD